LFINKSDIHLTLPIGQAGGEIADFFIIPRNTDAITTLSGKAYLSALVLVLLLAMLEAEVDFHAGDGYARKELR